MKVCSLCLVFNGNNVLLGMKKRGFGNGKWNGFGGKVLPGESIEDAAIRELEEEAGIIAMAGDLNKLAEIDFIFENNPDINNHTVVFSLEKWQGEPCESEEMKPQWFEMADIPFDEMWSCDAQWIPRVLSGEKIRAAVRFEDENVLKGVEIWEE